MVKRINTFFMVIILLVVAFLGNLTFVNRKVEASIRIDSSCEYIIYTKLCSWKCLQPKDFSSSNGTAVNLWDYWGQQSQRWKFVEAGDGYYYIVNADSGKVMDIANYSMNNGAENIIYDKGYGYNQQFKLIDNGNGYYKIENRNSGLILDLYGGKYDNGTKNIQYRDKDGDNQLWSLVPVENENDESEESNGKEMRNSQDIVNNMGIGWNLGNTLDSKASWINSDNATDYEQAWGNPITSKAMIDAIKAAGFNTVRIPVSWGEHLGSGPNYTVDSKWFMRVEEVINYVLDNDMYAIVNVHHDGDWCIPTYASEAKVSDKLQKLWMQIADRFKAYDNHLIFETLNEPRLEGTIYEWNGGTAEARTVVNRLNALALSTIRSTGGNNENRAVMIPTYAASGMSTTINDMVVPDDDNIIVSLHAYLPYSFAMDKYGTSYWGSNSDKASLDKELDSYYEAFVAKGIPVVIGEFGSINKNNTIERAALAQYFVSAAKERKIACIWWDNNCTTAGEGETFGIFNRRNISWDFPEIVSSMINGYNSVK